VAQGMVRFVTGHPPSRRRRRSRPPLPVPGPGVENWTPAPPCCGCWWRASASTPSTRP
jgi:hypothetical protein